VLPGVYAPKCESFLMNELFDPLNLVLAAVALMVVWRLRSVLGQRTGHERPPSDPYAPPRRTNGSAPVETGSGKVLEFPSGKDDSGKKPEADVEPLAPIWTGFAEAASPLAAGFEKLAQTDPSFSPKEFLEGAKLAYEMIVEAFAKGDKPALKNLLSREVYDGFSKAIDSRGQAGEKLDFQFVGFEKVDFASVALTGKRASIDIRFASQFISATFDKAGVLIDGNPKEVRDITDLWTFERDVAQKDPNWRVVATETQA
jgi:predicted lipid-binding transport protein (Tim44 family)